MSAGFEVILGTVLATKNNKTVQGLRVRLSPWEVRDNVPMIGLHGQVGRPLPGAQVLVLRAPRNPSKVVAIGTNDPRYFSPQPDGTTGFDHHLGAHVLAFDDRIEVDGGGRPVVVRNASKVRIEGDLEVTGEITAKAGTSASVTLSQHLQNGAKPTPGT